MSYGQGGAIDLFLCGTGRSHLTQEEGSCGEQMKIKIYLVGNEYIWSLTKGIAYMARIRLSHMDHGHGSSR